jgi:hypothetical protein|tara:strand:+ start:1460 stop:1921 length:462 start_codon:yes stop_codon:yes gene_type:complete
MGRTYRTMNGRSVDMDKLRSQNELTPAVGNMKVNARGDELGAGGKIVRTREQIVSSYYESNPKATPDADVPTTEPVQQPSVPNNPPSQTMTIEDTQPSSIVNEVEPAVEEVPVKQEATEQAEQVEEKVLDKGVEAVKRARSRRRGISDATGEK